MLIHVRACMCVGLLKIYIFITWPVCDVTRAVTGQRKCSLECLALLEAGLWLVVKSCVILNFSLYSTYFLRR